MSLPLYPLRTQMDGDREMVWDQIRKKWLVLTPEEHVRQCLIEYLIQEKGVPRGLISLEKGLKVARRRKRYDLLVYDRQGKALLACECKAPYVPLDRQAALQLSVYNSKIKAPFLLWTNGQLTLFYQCPPEQSPQRQEEVWTFEQMRP